VLALTDGLYAITITLLVLEIHVPELSNGQSLQTALRAIRPSFNAFVITFILAGMHWVGHRLFALIRRTDRGLVWLNIPYLLPLCVLPFGVSLLGRYEQEAVAVRLYGLVLLTIAPMRVATWLYVSGRPHLLWVPMDTRQRRAGLSLAAFPALAYLLAILLAPRVPTPASPSMRASRCCTSSASRSCAGA
jgi:TMEM175 potassium channel family protein